MGELLEYKVPARLSTYISIRACVEYRSRRPTAAALLPVDAFDHLDGHGPLIQNQNGEPDGFDGHTDRSDARPIRSHSGRSCRSSRKPGHGNNRVFDFRRRGKVRFPSAITWRL